MEGAVECVPRDKYILLVDNRQEQKLVRIKDCRKLNWRKTTIPLDQLAAHPFFTPLDVANNGLQPAAWEFGEPEEEQEEEENNNREIFELEAAQRLEAEEIERMKRELPASEIISGLVENNEQFSKRTLYSKQKYLRKKERKYRFRIHAQPATLDALHAYHFAHDPHAIAALRWDTLALLLLHAAPLAHVLLAEQTRGLLLAAALSRAAKTVTVASSHKKTLKNYPIVDQLNVPTEQQQAVSFVSWEEAGESAGGFDNLLLAGNYNFTEILERVEGKLREGARVALYCQSVQPLEEAGRWMRARKYLNVRLQDTWAREYQVLQNRTHPLMYMDSASGYLLTALKLAP